MVARGVGPIRRRGERSEFQLLNKLLYVQWVGSYLYVVQGVDNYGGVSRTWCGDRVVSGRDGGGMGVVL